MEKRRQYHRKTLTYLITYNRECYHQKLAHMLMKLEVSPDGAQRQKPDDNERGSYEQIQHSRSNNKRRQRRRVLVPDVAQSRQLISVHSPQSQSHDHLYGRQRPRYHVEVSGTGLDRLSSPSPCRRQVPRHGQADPPRRARHAEEVEDQRDGHAPDAFKSFADDEEWVAHVGRLVTGDGLRTDHSA